MTQQEFRLLEELVRATNDTAKEIGRLRATLIECIGRLTNAFENAHDDLGEHDDELGHFMEHDSRDEEGEN